MAEYTIADQWEDKHGDVYRLGRDECDMYALYARAEELFPSEWSWEHITEGNDIIAVLGARLMKKDQ